GATERDVVVGDAGRLRGGDVRVDVGARLGREAEVDDGRVAHLLDLDDRSGRNGARARHGRFDLGEVANARYFLLHDLRAGRSGRQARTAERRKPHDRRPHGAPPLGRSLPPVTSLSGSTFFFPDLRKPKYLNIDSAWPTRIRTSPRWSSTRRRVRTTAS